MIIVVVWFVCIQIVYRCWLKPIADEISELYWKEL